MLLLDSKKNVFKSFTTSHMHESCPQKIKYVDNTPTILHMLEIWKYEIPF
jgi:hypothetical protein